MSGYAPNPSSQNDNDYAPLTASLLARKGEAMPAVDAQAHAGVDIDMRPMRPANSPGAPRTIKQETIESLFPAKPEADSGEAPASNVRPFERPFGATPGHAPQPGFRQPDAWTVTPPRRPRPAIDLRPLRQADPDPGGRKATVTFRMPVKDFVRMRFAARDLEISCQSLILEALDCYLDANDVEHVSDEECAEEIERLMRLMKERRARKQQF